MDNVNLFEIATRSKLRFPTNHGELPVESLWDVPLRSKDDFDLDTVARTINTKLKSMAEESFVETKQNPQQTKLQYALEIVRYIIKVKLLEEEAAKIRVENKRRKEVLQKALAEKQDNKIISMSEEEIKKQLADLD